MDVVLPAAGEVTSLLDRGRRQRSFIDTSPRRLEATRERHERKAVTIRYDASRHELRIQLPRTLDAELFGEGEYTLEVLHGTLSKIKLTQRDPNTSPAGRSTTPHLGAETPVGEKDHSPK